MNLNLICIPMSFIYFFFSSHPLFYKYFYVNFHIQILGLESTEAFSHSQSLNVYFSELKWRPSTPMNPPPPLLPSFFSPPLSAPLTLKKKLKKETPQKNNTHTKKSLSSLRSEVKKNKNIFKTKNLRFQI